MRTLNIEVSDIEMNLFSIDNECIPFSELVELIGIKLTQNNLEQTVILAKKYNFSS
jgi:hypothetical protein